MAVSALLEEVPEVTTLGPGAGADTAPVMALGLS